MKTTGEFVRELNEKFPSDHLGREFAFSAGKKYDRIITSYKGENASAYAFVEKATGLLFKPASWSRPAKHSGLSKGDKYAGSLKIGEKAFNLFGPNGRWARNFSWA